MLAGQATDKIAAIPAPKNIKTHRFIVALFPDSFRRIATEYAQELRVAPALRRALCRQPDARLRAGATRRGHTSFARV
jgi:hypothetical protein